MSWDLEEDICCHPQSQGELGQLILVMMMDMFNVRRVSGLFLEVPFLKPSELRLGSSWARRFLRIMESLFLAYPWQERLILIQHSNQFMVYCQKAFSRERNLNKMISLWKIHMNSHQDVQDALSRERNLSIDGNSSVPHQIVQNLQKKNDNKMNIMIKKKHPLKNKLIPLKMILWVKMQLIIGKQKMHQMKAM